MEGWANYFECYRLGLIKYALTCGGSAAIRGGDKNSVIFWTTWAHHVCPRAPFCQLGRENCIGLPQEAINADSWSLDISCSSSAS